MTPISFTLVLAKFVSKKLLGGVWGWGGLGSLTAPSPALTLEGRSFKGGVPISTLQSPSFILVLTEVILRK